MLRNVKRPKVAENGRSEAVLVTTVRLKVINPTVRVVVGGNLRIAVGKRDEFIQRSLDAIEQARADGNCVDFSVSADPLDPDRVNIFEAWISTEALNQFRGKGPDKGLSELIESADVAEYTVSRH